MRGTANHLCFLDCRLTVVEAVQKLKANSSRWLGERGVIFQWQDGYGAFSVSPSLLGTVQAYIRNQRSIIGSGVLRRSFGRCWTNLASRMTRNRCLLCRYRL